MKFVIKPWLHQEAIFERAKDMPDYGLFVEMGGGKTKIAIELLRYKCYQKKRLLKTIIFCPPVVRNQWKKEIKANSAMVKDTVVLDKSGKKRIETFKKHSDGPKIFVTNYESLGMKDLFVLFKEWRPDVLVFDESHLIKSPQAKRTKAAIELADLAEHKYLLTGTPILNNAMDIWSQYRVLDGGETFDPNFYAFRAKYFHDKNAGMPKQKYFPDWRPRPGIEDKFNELIYRKASRVLKKDCMDLPPFVRQTIEVGLGPEQMKMYKQMERDFVAYLDDKTCVASIALTKGLRLQQIASGYFVDDEGTERVFKTNPRLTALVELIEPIAATGAKIIVWACFKKNYRDIVEALEKKYKVVTIVGGMTDKQRQKSIDDFQEGDAQIVVANQQAGGTGVNLFKASYAIYNSRNFSLEADLQSEARCYRGGSDMHDKVTRIDLVAPDTIDQVVLDALARKENLASNILSVKGAL